MELNGKTLSKIEEALLKSEFTSLQKTLSGIGEQIVKAFAKYGARFDRAGDTKADEAISAWVREAMFFNNTYCGEVEVDKVPFWIAKSPDGVKAKILEVVTKEFVDRVNSIEEIAQEVSRQQ